MHAALRAMESGPLAKASGGTPGAAHGGAAPVPRMVDHEVLEGLLPVVGSTPSIPSFLMSSHFLCMCTGFYGMRPVRYRFDHLSNVVKGPFCGGWRGATERPNGAKLCRYVEESSKDTHRYFGPNLRLDVSSALGR